MCETDETDEIVSSQLQIILDHFQLELVHIAYKILSFCIQIVMTVAYIRAVRQNCQKC